MKRRSFLTTGTSFLTAAATASAATSPAPASPPVGQRAALPDFKAGSRLLFQGDSITDMKWGRNQQDRNHYLGHSYVFLLAARLGVEMPASPLDFLNRGRSGNTLADLRKRWPEEALDLKPDLLSILVGTNDVGQGVEPTAFEDGYRHLLEASRKANPQLRLVLLDPFVLPTGPLVEKKAWQTRRSATDALGTVVAQVAADYDAVHVRTQQVFDAASQQAPPDHWIWDGIHPLPQGHELIARAWLQAVSTRWPMLQ